MLMHCARISLCLSGRIETMKRVLWLIPLLMYSCAHSPSQDVLLSSRTNAPLARNCRPLTEDERVRVLEAADPANFPATRYRQGPNLRRGVEKETDCSRFVHEIYKRAGLPYAFRATQDLGNAREFDLLPEKEALPGDLMLFRGHVGIVNDDGRIISALRTRRRHGKSSIRAIGRDNPILEAVVPQAQIDQIAQQMFVDDDELAPF